MRVQVDRAKCQAYGNCVDEAPDLFVLDDDGHATVVGDGSVPDGLQESARSAVRSCPARAIAITEG